MENNIKIYVDLDGTVADFETGFKRLTKGLSTEDYKRRILNYLNVDLKYPQRLAYQAFDQLFWDKCGTDVSFWANLPLMPGTMKLWNYIEKYNPIVLTATTSGKKYQQKVQTGKIEWVRKYFGNNIKVLFVELDSSNYLIDTKSIYCSGENDILIDDRETYIKGWNKKGGVGILHISARETIKKLKKLGI